MSYHLTELAWQAAEKVFVLCFFCCRLVFGHPPSHTNSLNLLGKLLLKEKKINEEFFFE
jgi:hypothetical protein